MVDLSLRVYHHFHDNLTPSPKKLRFSRLSLVRTLSFFTCSAIRSARIVPAKPNSFQVQAALIPHARVIFDAGAHIGKTAQTYRSLFPLADIYSFEPFPNSFNALKPRLPGDAHSLMNPLIFRGTRKSLNLGFRGRSDGESAGWGNDARLEGAI